MTKSPESVEAELSRALDALRLATTRAVNFNCTTDAIQLLLFPTIRECNAALAAFGDARELLRALRLLAKMRKAATLQLVLQQSSKNTRYTSRGTGAIWPVPAPTIVTYSTLMSRFLKANKPVVALRLWHLMINGSSVGQSPLLVDVKAANILMNCYAKLADVAAAKRLLEDMKIQQQPPQEPIRSAKATSPSRVQLPPPNSITYNTFLSACHKAGDLDSAVAAVTDMLRTKLQADALTYTTLIATVARRSSRIAGRNDPTPAFTFLQDMRDQGIVPNGMTYSALIDACGRCRRSDLALQGLRMMLRQKAEYAKEQAGISESIARTNVSPGKNYTLSGEVGAWTAAVNACGKAGRLETAMRLFLTMENFGVLPNAVTCGSLTDSLLRAGRTAETLDVLRYMKKAGIQPSEVMYTSLMSRAEKLVELERQTKSWREDQPLHPAEREIPLQTDEDVLKSRNTKAIEVYTELIDSLIKTDTTAASARKEIHKVSRPQLQDSKSLLLLKVFLVFQEMKGAGVEVDLPCYNTLLRACAQAGDVARAQEVIRLMQIDDLDPNDTSWRLLLRSASSTAIEGSTHGNRVALAENFWTQGLSHRRSRRRIDDPVTTHWVPSVESFVALISVYIREAEAMAADCDKAQQQRCYRRVVQLFDAVLMGHEDMGMNRIDVNRLLESQRAMLGVVQSIVYLEESLQCTERNEEECRTLRSMSTSILKLDCFVDCQGNAVPSTAKLGPSARKAIRIARSWTT